MTRVSLPFDTTRFVRDCHRPSGIAGRSAPLDRRFLIVVFPWLGCLQRFVRPKEQEVKVALDSRFTKILKDKRFQDFGSRMFHCVCVLMNGSSVASKDSDDTSINDLVLL